MPLASRWTAPPHLRALILPALRGTVCEVRARRACARIGSKVTELVSLIGGEVEGHALQQDASASARIERHPP